MIKVVRSLVHSRCNGLIQYWSGHSLHECVPRAAGEEINFQAALHIGDGVAWTLILILRLASQVRCVEVLTLPMLRLLSSKAQGCKDF